MWRYGLWQAGKLIASVIGALLLAAVLAALSHHTHGFWPALDAFSSAATNMIRGDFGVSSVTGHAAVQDVSAVLPQTLELVFAGLIIAFLIGVPLGAFLSASRTLRAAAPLMQIVAAAPIFCAALAMIWFAVHMLHGSAPMLRLFALPVHMGGEAGAACVQISLRRTAATELRAPYRAGLRMMGLGALEIDLRYVVPEFAAGLLRSFGEIVLALLAAAAVAEWVFDRDGAVAVWYCLASDFFHVARLSGYLHLWQATRD